jgi:hypothetical protein
VYPGLQDLVESLEEWVGPGNQGILVEQVEQVGRVGPENRGNLVEQVGLVGLVEQVGRVGLVNRVGRGGLVERVGPEKQVIMVFRGFQEYWDGRE